MEFSHGIHVFVLGLGSGLGPIIHATTIQMAEEPVCPSRNESFYPPIDYSWSQFAGSATLALLVQGTLGDFRDFLSSVASLDGRRMWMLFRIQEV